MTEEQLYTVYKGMYLSVVTHPPEALKYFEEFSFRPDDIIIATYPKSGESTVKVTKLRVGTVTSNINIIKHKLRS